MEQKDRRKVKEASWKPNTTEIVGNAGSQLHRGLKSHKEKPVRHVFMSHRSDFPSVQLICIGTKILLITEKVHRRQFHYTWFLGKQIPKRFLCVCFYTQQTKREQNIRNKILFRLMSKDQMFSKNEC